MMKKDLSPTLFNDLRDKAEEIEADGQGFKDRAFALRLFSKLSLPYTNPHSEKLVRKNGEITFMIQCPKEYGGVPYGKYPRLLHIFLETEAVKRKHDLDPQNPVIKTGSTLTAFLENLGVSSGGKQAIMALDQLKALYGTTYFLEFASRKLQKGIWYEGEKFKRLNLIDKYEMYYDKNNPDQKNLSCCEGEVTLNQTYFKAIIDEEKNNMMPIDLRIIRILQGSPLRLDIYSWLSARCFALEKPSAPIALMPLTRDQFGIHYKRHSDEQKYFFRELKKVLSVCPQFGVRTSEKGLILLPLSKE